MKTVGEEQMKQEGLGGSRLDGWMIFDLFLLPAG